MGRFKWTATRPLRARAEEDDESEEDKPKTKTVKETVWDWELLNDNKALWLRSPGDVSEEEYVKFYQALAKARLQLCYKHNKEHVLRPLSLYVAALGSGRAELRPHIVAACLMMA